MSMFSRYTPRGRPPEKMDLLAEQLALITQNVENMCQQRGMQVTEPEEVYEDMNHVHPMDQSWSYSDCHPSQGGYNYYSDGRFHSNFLDESLDGHMKPASDELINAFLEHTEVYMNTLPQSFISEQNMEPQGKVEYVNYIQQVDQNKAYDDYSLTMSTPDVSFGYSDYDQQPPHNFSMSYGVIDEPQKISTEELLIAFMERTEAYMESSSQRLDKIEKTMGDLSTHMEMMATQMSQIAHAVTILHQPEQFPEQEAIHPKECKAIGLKSCITHESLSIPEGQSKMNYVEDEKGIVDEEKKEIEEEVNARLKKKRPKRKNKLAKMKGVPSSESLMMSWWMKQLNRLIPAILAKSKDADSIIRFRIN